MATTASRQSWAPRFLSSTDECFKARWPNLGIVVEYKVERNGSKFQVSGTEPNGNRHWHGPAFDDMQGARSYWVCFRHSFMQGFGLEVEGL